MSYPAVLFSARKNRGTKPIFPNNLNGGDTAKANRKANVSADKPICRRKKPIYAKPRRGALVPLRHPG